MSFDIPAYIEPEIEKFAQAQHITANEAVLRLIEAGLQVAGNSMKGAQRDKKDPLSLIRDARLSRAGSDEPISALDFFEEIQNTNGFKSKADAHRHVQELRNEWR